MLSTCYTTADPDESVQAFDKKYMELYNAAYETESVLNIHSGGDLPLRGLAACYRELGDEEQAAEYAGLADKWSCENA